MHKLIFSITPTQFENERNFSIAGVLIQEQRSSLTIKNLAMLTFINNNLQLHEKLNDEDVEYEDIDLRE